MAEHPITPPPELIEQWSNAAHELDGPYGPFSYTRSIANQAARWGADQQLELDARWLDHNALNETHLKITPIGDVLKEAMRLEPPSLKEQALQILDVTQKGWGLAEVDLDTIRRALEALPND
jgi:hypothetical protein